MSADSGSALSPESQDAPDAAARLVGTTGPVRIVGTGLLGSSIGLGLTTRGVDVVLADASPTAAALAQHMGAGRVAPASEPEPNLIVVAAPPDVTAAIIAHELAAHPRSIVTDVASVKGAVLDELRQLGADLTRYVGSHPLAGSERSGPTAGRGDLFAGRPWVITASSGSSPEAQMAVRTLAVDLGAVPLPMDAVEHDSAVALVSHVPQLVASLMAARLVEAPPAALDLAGQGLRDVTRIAASDPSLWVQILAANSVFVGATLRALREDLDDVVGALGELDQFRTQRDADPAKSGQPLAVLASAITDGNLGQARIPGKHGAPRHAFDVVVVIVPDEAGQLGRLFADTGAAGVNIEDFSLEHAPRQPVGLATLSVPVGSGPRLETALRAAGWVIAG